MQQDQQDFTPINFGKLSWFLKFYCTFYIVPNLRLICSWYFLYDLLYIFHLYSKVGFIYDHFLTYMYSSPKKILILCIFKDCFFNNLNNLNKGFAIPMQLNLVKSTPVYALLKGFSVIQDIGNIPVIQVHLLLFINSFFTIGLALQRRMNKGSLKELSFFPNSYSFSNTVIYASLPTPKPRRHKLEPC